MMNVVIKIERDMLKELISSNKNLIYSIVYKFSRDDIEDLFQVGVIGLIKAYKNYNMEYNTKFTTYAYPYIVGEIYKYVNANHNIKVGNDYSKIYRNINKAREYLRQCLLREPTDLEICNYLEIDLYTFYELNNMMDVESLDYNYENNNMYDYIKKDNVDIDSIIDLKNALKGLSYEERLLIIKRYFYNISQQDIAKNTNTNQVKISREEKKILCKLKTKMN